MTRASLLSCCSPLRARRLPLRSQHDRSNASSPPMRRRRYGRTAPRRGRCRLTPSRKATSSAPPRRTRRRRSPMRLLARGRERFGIFCAPCHGLAGDGDGIIVAHGFPAPPSYHIDRLLAAPAQHFFDVITDGYGVMYLLRRPHRSARPLGDRRLYPRSAIVAPRQGRGGPRRRGAHPMSGGNYSSRRSAERRVRRRCVGRGAARRRCLLRSESSRSRAGSSALHSGRKS